MEAGPSAPSTEHRCDSASRTACYAYVHHVGLFQLHNPKTTQSAQRWQIYKIPQPVIDTMLSMAFPVLVGVKLENNENTRMRLYCVVWRFRTASVDSVSPCLFHLIFSLVVCYRKLISFGMHKVFTYPPLRLPQMLLRFNPAYQLWSRDSGP